MESAEPDVAVQHLSVQHIRRADEAGDERGGGFVVDLVRAADLFDLAFVHDDDLVGELHRLLLVVGDQQAGHAQLTVKLIEPATQVLADLRIERAERFVQEQDLRARC